jgi:hypothetical protein
MGLAPPLGERIRIWAHVGNSRPDVEQKKHGILTIMG